MASQLEISVILTTFQRPDHLARSLASLALQRGMGGKYEVIVADDGSKDSTHSVVRRFAQSANFPVKLTTHPHDGFRVALCRNDGVRASSAPYLLFTDGDCIFPPDHLRQHLNASRPKVARAGSCVRLSRESTEKLDLAAVAAGKYRAFISSGERLRLLHMRIKNLGYQLIGHQTKPKLTGWNIGISRDDLEAVNGFDESFVGWGCEDDDLAFRLRKNGVRIISALGYTNAYHMWHPVDATRPVKWMDGLNVGRLQHDDRPIRCRSGLVPIIEIEKHRADSGGKRASCCPSQRSTKAA
jgi:GT2 family glycosyltransferase